MDRLRNLPSVDEMLCRLKSLDSVPRTLLLEEIRAELSERRSALLLGKEPDQESLEYAITRRIRDVLQPTLRPVINATGIILHTNLGRAPSTHFEPIWRYMNLEYDLESGKRGRRDIHTAAPLGRLLKKPTIVVNNNAAAVYLVLHELAVGHEVIVSRGELIEIGEGFRIPEVMAKSGAILREVGTTNRTTVEDYRRAINDRTGLILRVHPSNFRIKGFVSRPDLKALALMGRDYGIHVYENLGSGSLLDLRHHGIEEPCVIDSLEAGASVVSFSCDKLLGGPQAGIIAGMQELIDRIRCNQMYRAFRVDKWTIQALQATLSHLLAQRWQAIPTLDMIFASLDEIRRRAEEVKDHLDLRTELRRSESAIGGGSTPDQTLPTWTIELAVQNVNAFERRLRCAPMPVISRIEHDRVILDMRTVSDDEIGPLVATVQEAVDQLHLRCQSPHTSKNEMSYE